MLSELLYLQAFDKDGLAAMSLEHLESCLASAKRQIADYEERERENERQGVFILENSSSRICYMAKMFFETELELRKRRALNEDRLTLLKELRKVKRELGYDRERFPDRREIILGELLIEKGGQCIADRRYSRAVDEASKVLDEELERERLLRDETHSGRTEEPRRD